MIAETDKLHAEIRRLLTELHVQHRSCSRARLYMDAERGCYGIKSFRSAVYEATTYTYSYNALLIKLKASWTLKEGLSKRNFERMLRNHDLFGAVKKEPVNPLLFVDGVEFLDQTKAARAIVSKLCPNLVKISQERLQEKFFSLETANAAFRNDQLDSNGALRGSVKEL